MYNKKQKKTKLRKKIKMRTGNTRKQKKKIKEHNKKNGA